MITYQREIFVFWIVFIFWIPFAALSSIDSYQRSYMVAWLSTMGLQATISAVIFVVLYSWVLQGGYAKLKKKQVRSDAVNIKWKDVIGMEGAKMEAKELVSLIKDRARVKKIGGNVIRVSERRVELVLDSRVENYIEERSESLCDLLRTRSLVVRQTSTNNLGISACENRCTMSNEESGDVI